MSFDDDVSWTRVRFPTSPPGKTMRPAYSDNQLNVKVTLPLSFDFEKVPGVLSVTQVFPNNPKLAGWYIVNVEPENLMTVKSALEKQAGVMLVEKVALRYPL